MTKSEFIKSNIQWAKGILSAPNYKFPNGKMAHDVAAVELEKYDTEWYEYCLDFGLYDANGKLAGFVE